MMLKSNGEPATLADLHRAYLRVLVSERMHHAASVRVRKNVDRGIRRAARALDCSAPHLSLVLRGERRSMRLMARYAAWRRAHGV
jgi:hypothetical protein